MTLSDDLMVLVKREEERSASKTPWVVLDAMSRAATELDRLRLQLMDTRPEDLGMTSEAFAAGAQITRSVIVWHERPPPEPEWEYVWRSIELEPGMIATHKRVKGSDDAWESL